MFALKWKKSISNLLSGLTTFAGSVGEVVSGAFSTATESLVEWTENDGATITEFLENLQLQFADVFNFIGQISEISEQLSANGGTATDSRFFRIFAICLPTSAQP